MTRRNVTLIGATGVILGLGIFAASARPRESAAEGVATPPVVTAERRDLVVSAEAPGSIEPIRTVEVKSRASGEVLGVFVETGDRVEQGQLLAEIDPRDVQNALDQAIADLDAAEVQASTTQANRSRMEKLRGLRVITEQEFEGAVQAAASARAAAVRARTNLQLARERRNDVTIRAPIAGTILADNVEPGQIIASATGNVSGGTTLFTMADLSEMQVRTLVDETDIGQIHPEQGAQVVVEAYAGRAFQGEVYKIEPQAVVEQNVTMFPVLVRLANPDDLLKPGMNAEVAVEIARRSDVLLVPNGAVVTRRNAASTAAMLGLDAKALGAGPGPPSGGAERGAASARTGEAAQGMSAEGDRQGVVFVRRLESVEARPVVLGISDWESTEVIEGLEAGERVLDVSGAQLEQAQQQEIEDRQKGRPAMMGAGGRGAGG